jgi:hypothetical protein
MIRTDAGLRATRESLAHLENALLGLTRNRAKYHPKTFALLAEPILEDILARRAEIDEYIGFTPLQPDRAPTLPEFESTNVRRLENGSLAAGTVQSKAAPKDLAWLAKTVKPRKTVSASENTESGFVPVVTIAG